MPTLAQIKSRITNVKSTNKLISAMQTIAALRMRKNAVIANSAKAYKGKLDQLGALLKDNVDLTEIAKEYQKFFGPQSSTNEQTTEIKKPILSIIISPTRGFCKGLHRSTTLQHYRYLQQELGLDTNNPDVVKFITVNKPALKQVTRLGGFLVAAFNNLPKNPTKYDILAISELVFQLFLQKDFSKVIVSYIDYQTGNITNRQILPFDFENLPAVSSDNSEGYYLIDSEPSKILNEYLHQQLQAQIYFMLWSTSAAEEKARMVAMNQANDNAKELTKKLQLSYFKQRQSKITQEMNEIIGGMV